MLSCEAKRKYYLQYILYEAHFNVEYFTVWFTEEIVMANILKGMLAHWMILFAETKSIFFSLFCVFFKYSAYNIG